MVQTLAGLSLFVIVDITDPKSTPLEIEATVKQSKIPYVPIIDLSVDQKPFAMIVDLQKSFHWVLQTFGYYSKEKLLENIEEAIISHALKKHNELREQKAAETVILTIEDLKKDKDN
jgi:ABC-type polar amino acid transport system ATPase subunit